MELLDLYHHPYSRPLSVAFSSVACIFVSIYFLDAGYTIIFQNLFYIPIILACVIYIWRGFLFSCILAFTYLGLMLEYTGNPDIIIEAFTRVIIFIGIAAVVTFFALINQRSKVEVQQLAAFRESIINNARVWLTVLNKKGEILLWNAAAEEITGYKNDEVMGKNTIWKQLYPKKEYRREISDTITRIIAENQFFENFQTTILTKNGKKRFISWNTKEIPAETEKESTFVAIGVDVTRLRESEYERNKAMEQIQKNMAQLSILNDGIRNPLTVILTHTELLSGENGISIIKEQTDRINDMVTQLDQRWLESEAVLEVLRKYYHVSINPQNEMNNRSQEDVFDFKGYV